MRAIPLASLVLALAGGILTGPVALAQDATPGATSAGTPVVAAATPVAASPAAASPVGASAAIPDAAGAATPAAEAAEVLFVQSFTTGRLEPGAEPGAAVLTLQGPVGETVYFSDRPQRSAGTIALAQFLEVLAQDSADPLNAALVIDRAEGDAVVVVELLDGSVDAAGTVIYDVRVLAETASFHTDMTVTAEMLTELTGAIDFGSSHLFVDGACSPWDPRC